MPSISTKFNVDKNVHLSYLVVFHFSMVNLIIIKDLSTPCLFGFEDGADDQMIGIIHKQVAHIRKQIDHL